MRGPKNQDLSMPDRGFLTGRSTLMRKKSHFLPDPLFQHGHQKVAIHLKMVVNSYTNLRMTGLPACLRRY